MEWIRGKTIGQGSFAKVDLAVMKSGPVMAVKSAPAYNSESLRNEKEVLGLLGNCENVIRCFGENHSSENGEQLYNLFLEYADGGSLYDFVRKGGEKLSEIKIRSFTRSVLSGLKEIHENGFVHCDVKLQNILLCSDNSDHKSGLVAKISDFGLAKRQSRAAGKRGEVRGTPLYMAPETVVDGEFESPADVWAVGCAVVEMLTGAPAWRNETNVASLLLKISTQSPELPQNLSAEGRDFLEKCFIRNAGERWTAAMLLNHPFAAAEGLNSKSESEKSTTSPRCPFDFPEFLTPSPNSTSAFDSWMEKDEDYNSTFNWDESPENPPAAGFRHLVSNQVPNWEFSGSWLRVR